MTAAEIVAKHARRKQETAALTLVWQTYFFDQEIPNQRQFNIWLDRYDLARVAQGIEAAGAVFNRITDEPTDHEKEMFGVEMTTKRLYKLVSGCCKNHRTVEEQRED